LRERLLDCAVDEATLRVYTARAREFLAWVEAEGATGRLDSLLAQFVSALCFDAFEPPSRAAQTLSAVLHFCPGLKGSLPRTARAVSAFRALVRAPERPPFSRRTVGAIVACLLLRGDEESALVVAFSFEILARVQDWANLRRGDVHAPPGGSRGPLGLTLGRSDLGEKTKTGWDLGSVVKSKFLCWWLLDWLDRSVPKRPSSKVFAVSPQDFRYAFRRALDLLGLPDETPHVLRHTGATELFAAGATLSDLKIAGRWSSDASVKRYTKPHLLAKHEAGVIPSVLALGDDFWRDPWDRVLACRRRVLLSRVAVSLR